MKELVSLSKWFVVLAILSLTAMSMAHPETARAKKGVAAQPSTSGAPAPATGTGAAAIFGIDEGGFLVNNPLATQKAVDSGAHWTRMEIDWAAIEPTQGGPYVWTDADKALNGILASGLQPVVYISYNPSWVAAGNIPPCAPIDTTRSDLKTAFYNMMYATVSRYPAVPIWALYNEEDSPSGDSNSTGQGCFGSKTAGGINKNGVPDYAEYAIMLNLAWKAVHAANPSAKLATGALAFDNFAAGADFCPPMPGYKCEGQFNYYFAPNLFKYMGDNPLHDGSQYMDMVLFNYYEIYGPYWQKQAKGRGIQAKANMLRSLMTQGGIAQVDLLVTETGETSSDSWVGLQGQARCVTITLSRGAAAKLKGVIWWTFKDYSDLDPVTYRRTWKYGIVDQNMVAKPSFTAMQTIVNELNGYNYTKTMSDKVGFKGVEDYMFKLGKSAKHVVVSSVINTGANGYAEWHQDCSQPRKNVKVTYKAKSVRIVDYMGGTIKTILDNKKGDKDKTVGKIAFPVGPDPKIVQINP